MQILWYDYPGDLEQLDRPEGWCILARHGEITFAGRASVTVEKCRGLHLRLYYGLRQLADARYETADYGEAQVIAEAHAATLDLWAPALEWLLQADRTLDEARAAQCEALAVFAAPDMQAHPLEAGWDLPRSSDVLPAHRTWSQQVALRLARAWAHMSQHVSQRRDPLISLQLSAGASKAEVHRATGISRATIDRVVGAEPTG